MRDKLMFTAMINFTNLLVAALVVGATFGVWLIFNPAGLDAGSYVAQQQIGIRALNVAMPALGGLTFLLTIVSAVLAKDDRTRLAMLLVAAICFLMAGLITRFANQPINATIMTWSIAAPPAEWTQLRDDWWRWHVARLGLGLAGLCLLIAATLKRAVA